MEFKPASEIEIRPTNLNKTLNSDYAADSGVTLVIPNSYLVELHAHKVKGLQSYISLINSTLNHIQLVDNDKSRLEDRLRRICSELKSSVTKKSTLKTREELTKFKFVSIKDEELENVKFISRDLKAAISECKELRAGEMKLATVSTALEAAKGAIAKTDEGNAELCAKLKELSKKTPSPNSGKKIHHHKAKQRKIKKTKCYGAKAKSALWFSDSYGLSPKELICEDGVGQRVAVSLQDEVSNKGESSKENQDRCKFMYVMDSRGVSDDTYHEFASLCPDLPRTHVLVKKRQKVNEEFEVHRTKFYPGAYVSVRKTVQELVEKNPEVDTIRIKFGGDGAQVSRIRNYVSVCMAVVNEKEPDLSVNALRTVCVSEIDEKYDTLKKTLDIILEEVNAIIHDEEVTIFKDTENEKTTRVEFVLGGDMKFLLAVTGLNAAHSNHACLFCKIHKDDRWKMDLPMDYYESGDMIRLNEGEGWKDLKFGRKEEPLIDLDVKHIVIDELHLMLRIMDVMISNLIEDSRSLQFEHNFVAGKRRLRSTNIKIDRDSSLGKLAAACQSCGVKFEIWEQKDANGKLSGKLDCTSLTGPMKKLLLSELPGKLNQEMIHEDSRTQVVLLWKEFDHLYSYIRKIDPDPNVSFEMAKAWVELFLSLGSKRDGYQKAKVTPYVHILVYHVPCTIMRFGNIIQFSGQGLEKLNDNVRKLHLRKSNRWDGTKEALLACKRIEYCRDNNFVREKRTYNKVDETWWGHGLREARAEKRKSVLREIGNESS